MKDPTYHFDYSGPFQHHFHLTNDQLEISKACAKSPLSKRAIAGEHFASHVYNDIKMSAFRLRLWNHGIPTRSEYWPAMCGKLILGLWNRREVSHALYENCLDIGMNRWGTPSDSLGKKTREKMLRQAQILNWEKQVEDGATWVAIDLLTENQRTPLEHLHRHFLHKRTYRLKMRLQLHHPTLRSSFQLSPVAHQVLR